MSEPLLTIGEVARASGLTVKALRLYDEAGLLTPTEVDAATGYRRYAAGQLGRARLVARLRRVGMPLARIRVVADLPPAAAAAELTSYSRQVGADAATTRRALADLGAELVLEEAPVSHATTAPDRPVRTAARTGIGGRELQLDAVLVDRTLTAVADGCGATPGVADAALAALGSPRSVAELDDAVRLAADAVAAAAGSPADGTTLTALVVAGRDVLIAHLGDSRAHLVRSGRVERLTRDHTVVQALVDEGRLSPDEALIDDRRAVINRALSADTSSGAASDPDLAVRASLPGDRFVLTTDGVHATLDPAHLATLLVDGAEPADVADAVAAAVETAGAPDNWSVVVVDLVA